MVPILVRQLDYVRRPEHRPPLAAKTPSEMTARRPLLQPRAAVGLSAAVPGTTASTTRTGTAATTSGRR